MQFILINKYKVQSQSTLDYLPVIYLQGKVLMLNQLPFVIHQVSGILPSGVTWLVLKKYK